jgi:hypothetical protein
MNLSMSINLSVNISKLDESNTNINVMRFSHCQSIKSIRSTKSDKKPKTKVQQFLE